MIKETGRKFAEYAHGQGVTTIIYLDSAVRLAAHAVSEYWQQTYSGIRPPATYYLNPSGLFTRGDMVDHVTRVWGKYANPQKEPENVVRSQLEDSTINAGRIFTLLAPATQWGERVPDIPPQELAESVLIAHSPLGIKLAQFDTREARDPIRVSIIQSLHQYGKTVDEIGKLQATGFLDDAAIWLVTASKYADRLKNVRIFEAEVLDDLQSSFPSFTSDPERQRVLVVDICRDTRTTTDVVRKRLASVGIATVFTGIVNERQENYDREPSDVYTKMPLPDGTKNVFRDSLYTGQSSRVVSSRWTPASYVGSPDDQRRLNEAQQTSRKQRVEIHRVFDTTR